MPSEVCQCSVPQRYEYLCCHEGQQELTVYMSGSLAASNEAFWNEFTRQMLAEMQKYTTSDLRQWLVPDFTTSTDKDRLVGQIVMMGAMKKYFSFNKNEQGEMQQTVTCITCHRGSPHPEEKK